MEILVLGGTGFVGSHLCRELAEREHDVTALARSPEDATLPDGVRTVHGDVTDYASIEDAFEGKAAVVNLVAVSPLTRPKGGPRMHDVVHRAGTENAVRAAEAVDVGTFVQLSGVNADPDGPTAYLRAKGRAEEIVRSFDGSWVIFRPSVVFGQGEEFTPFVKMVALPYLTPLPGGGRSRFQPIWVGDLVPMIADAIEDDEHVGETYEIAGPETFTLAEIARLAHRADGRPVNVLPVPMPLAGLGMSIGRFIPGFPFGPDQYRSLQLDLVAADNDIEPFGVGPGDLKTYGKFLGVESKAIA